jgi:hypothetical protein
MKITLDLENTHLRNIKAIEKAIERKPLSAADTLNLYDTKTLLIGIEQFLKKAGENGIN